jgi:hypothetical protein
LSLTADREDEGAEIITMSKSKRFGVSIASPLEDPDILLHMLNILGPGHHLFFSAVSKAWREMYERVASVQMAGVISDYEDVPLMYTITLQTTLSSAIFASTSATRLAYECGLAFNNVKLQRIAGRIAGVPTLQAAHALGLQLTGALLTGAAEAASVPKLQWLHSDQGCALPDDISYYAANSGSMDTLRWLRQHGCLFSSRTCEGAAAGADVQCCSSCVRRGASGAPARAPLQP